MDHGRQDPSSSSCVYVNSAEEVEGGGGWSRKKNAVRCGATEPNEIRDGQKAKASLDYR